MHTNVKDEEQTKIIINEFKKRQIFESALKAGYMTALLAVASDDDQGSNVAKQAMKAMGATDDQLRQLLQESEHQRESEETV